MTNINPWLMLAVAAMLIISTAIVTRSCSREPVSDGTLRPFIEIVDTVRVQTVQERTIYRDRIRAQVDTVYIDTEPAGYVATMDTLIAIPKGSVETRVKFYHPQGLFDFWQNAKIQADTVYVNKTKILELTKTRHNWWLTAGGLIVGTAIGIIIMR